MHTRLSYMAGIIAGLVLGFLLAQYAGGGMLAAFLHKLPGRF